MPFIEDILQYKSLSIVGLAKNTGKTECFNYILDRVKESGKKIALTSIGIDGESRDIVTDTHKPGIWVHKGMIFISAEKHYLQKRVSSEIIDLSSIKTSLGYLVTAKALGSGRVILSGPPDTIRLKSMIQKMQHQGVELTIVDGALSRLSLASPAITEAMVLTTGAAVSASLNELNRKTRFVVDLIHLPEVEQDLKQPLSEIESGMYAVSEAGELKNLGIDSVFELENKSEQLFKFGKKIFVAGLVSNKLFNLLGMQREVAKIELIVKDFSKIFASAENFHSFIRKGGTVKVVHRTKLIAVCINPFSPKGFNLNSDKLKETLEKSLQMPVYDVKKIIA